MFANRHSRGWRSKRNQIISGFLVACLLLLVSEIGGVSYIIKRIDFFFYDALVKVNLKRMNWPPPVYVVDIDDQSTQIEGRWPWSRDKVAKLLDKLRNAGVVTVAFDVIFSDLEKNSAINLQEHIKENSPLSPEDKQKVGDFLNQLAPYVDNDKLFADSLSQSDVIMGYFFHDGSIFSKGALPQPLRDEKNQVIDAKDLTVHQFQGYFGVAPELLAAAKHAGFATNIPDIDGLIRRSVLLGKYDNKLYSSLALTAVMRYLLADTITLTTEDKDGKKILTGLTVGGISIPISEEGFLLIPFFGGAKTALFLSATDVLHDKVSLASLAGSIVVVGSSATLLADIHPSPVSQVFPGVEMNSNLITGILNQLLIKTFDWQQLHYYRLGILLFFVFALPFVGGIYLVILYTLIMAGLLVGIDWFYVTKHLYVPIAFIVTFLTYQMLFNFIYSFVAEKRQKNQIQGLFGQYVPASHIKTMLAQEEAVSMDGETREMTVFFADIRSFTTISEQLPAQQVKRLLNEFFTPITKIIFDKQGTIDKYVGDMIMAFWGAPLKDEQHALHAIDTVMTIKARMPEIVNYLKELSLPPVQIGMGLSTGPMDVGDMGSTYRRAYTVLGDTVNLASRLQDLTKFYGAAILVSESTRANQDAYLWRKIDKVAVKGKSSAVSIYEPLGLMSEVSPALIEEVAEYHLALKYYYEKQWDKALSTLADLLSRDKDSVLYQVYQERILAYQQMELPEDWDGVFVHTHK